jgi:class 3 adenylate cyclase
LKGGEKTIANGHHIVSVMFADLCGFTALSRKTTPDALVRMLNELFTAFDNIVENHRVEKIKTIGDCYMLVGGLPNHRDDHAHVVADAAIDMVEALETINKKNGTELAMRIGIHSGPVVAGVIGKIKFTYDLWGDTVNVASRMESSGMPGRVTTAMIGEPTNSATSPAPWTARFPSSPPTNPGSIGRCGSPPLAGSKQPRGFRTS